MGRVIAHDVALFLFNLLTNVAIRRTPPHRCPYVFRYLPCVYLRSEEPQHQTVTRYHGDHRFTTTRTLSYIRFFILSGLPTYRVVRRCTWAPRARAHACAPRARAPRGVLIHGRLVNFGDSHTLSCVMSAGLQQGRRAWASRTHTGRWHSQNTESFDSRHSRSLFCLFTLCSLPFAPFPAVRRQARVLIVLSST